jgi:hypothetical protein
MSWPAGRVVNTFDLQGSVRGFDPGQSTYKVVNTKRFCRMRQKTVVPCTGSRCDRNVSPRDRRPQNNICALSTVMVRVSDIILTKERRGLIHPENSKRTIVQGGLNLLLQLGVTRRRILNGGSRAES